MDFLLLCLMISYSIKVTIYFSLVFLLYFMVFLMKNSLVIDSLQVYIILYFRSQSL